MLVTSSRRGNIKRRTHSLVPDFLCILGVLGLGGCCASEVGGRIEVVGGNQFGLTVLSTSQYLDNIGHPCLQHPLHHDETTLMGHSHYVILSGGSEEINM